MKFGYTIVYVDDVPATLAFYQRAFGFDIKFLHESNEYGELDTGATALAFASLHLAQANFDGKYQPVNPKADLTGIELAFVADDVQQAYDHAIQFGALALSSPTLKPWGQVVAYVRAPEGTIVELCSAIG